jgi:tetratricopeptide (TPR) repeat protein
LFSPRLTLTFVLWFAASAADVAVASAAPAAIEETARAHHEQGRIAVSTGRYEAAIAEYRRAYELKADPSFLYDIAEAYRGLGVPERAVFFYRRYLSTHPNPPNRPEVEGQIAELEPPAPPPPAAPAAEIAVAAPPLVLVTPAHPVSDRERSVVGRWWFWTAVGALAAAGATVAILAATKDRGGNDVPQTPLGNARIDF